MNKKALAELFYRETLKVVEHPKLSLQEKVSGCYEILLKLLEVLTQEEQLSFNTLFAKIAYVGHKYRLSKKLQYYLHHFRIRVLRERSLQSEDLDLAVKVNIQTIRFTLDSEIPSCFQPHHSYSWPFAYEETKVRSFIPQVRVLVIGEEPEQRLLLAKPVDNPAEVVKIKYGIAERNEIFNPTIAGMRAWIKEGLNFNLLDVNVDDHGVYHPAAFVLEPDYLIDVSSISECFKGPKAEISRYLLRKFWPFFPSIPLVLGNISNFFLDELLVSSEIDFRTTFRKAFKMFPLALSLFDDQQIRDLYQKAALHFYHLRKVVVQDLPKLGIDTQAGCIEPSFYSEKYGLQGRLDLFFEGTPSGIVELKSGKIYRPNSYGLGQNHFIQTLLYDLLIQSAYANKIDPANYILYSGATERQLRFAPRVKAQQWEALQFRNQIILTEKLLAAIHPTYQGFRGPASQLLHLLSPTGCGWLSGFEKRRVEEFNRHFHALSVVEKKFFLAFSGFIAREHSLAKTGIHGSQKSNGQATLWLTIFREKLDDYKILNQIQFVAERSENDLDQYLVFKRSQYTCELANFRQGDIAILYPHKGEDTSPLSHQIFKCTIVHLDEVEIWLRLRTKQSNKALFTQFDWWNLEHDTLDSGFNGMYTSLFEWMTAEVSKRELHLGLRAPNKVRTTVLQQYEKLTEEQSRILNRALCAKDYFLLWGPPGTGKTSILIKYLTKYLLENTNENLLLMAYTNRAVDEICESVESIGEDVSALYFRIGSTHSTAARFRKQLLKTKIKDVKNREELLQLIDKHRIVVSTVAGMLNKPELFALKTFHTAIIDEASQILEPLLAGLLPRFRKFILVGDHKQLPAVVVQDQRHSVVQDDDLRQIGLTNLNNSLFERLYRLCLANRWTWAYDQLSCQGRMHQSIMAFPNRFFYENSLSILPAYIPRHQQQKSELKLVYDPNEKPLAASLASNRLLFVDTPADTGVLQQKTNKYEAAAVARIISTLRDIYHHNQIEVDAESIGVITPYRAQIALIRKTLHTSGLDAFEVTVDTVERYQGGARKIIIISLCTNHFDRIRTLTSYTDEGIDRKLNVALTRAKEQLILIGNAKLLEQLPLYKELIKACHCLTYTQLTASQSVTTS